MVQAVEIIELIKKHPTKVFSFGFDIGNLHGRIQWGKKKSERQICASYVLEIEEDKSFPGMYKCLTSTASHKYVNKCWLTGAEALDVNQRAGSWVKNDNVGKAELAFPIFAHLAWDEIEAENTVLNVALSVHDPAALKKQAKANLEGIHEVEKDGVVKKFEIKVLAVYAEGIGVIRGEKAKKLSFLFDLGSNTLIGSAFVGYESRCEPWYGEFIAGNQLITNIASCSKISEILKRKPTFEEVRQCLENPVAETKVNKKGESRNISKYKIAGKDITEVVNCEAEKWLKEGLNDLEGMHRKNIVESQDKIATGGCCLIPKVKEILQARGYRIAAEPLWSNVNGLFEIAETLTKKVGG
ncbi:hypothetical protein H6F51_18070 [Cyanobacteria bacterium FACHB-DQ100]|nr:hypothetical protein [Cyanobacteria bacterium FACHB-DQ100]